MPQINRKMKHFKNMPPYLAVTLSVVFCVAIAAISAYAWQSASASDIEADKPFSPSEYKEEQERAAEMARESESLEQSSEESSAEQSASDTDDLAESSQVSTEGEGVAQQISADATVPMGERVHSSYFDDAVFIGDSLTTGIQLYSAMPNATVYADTGINLYSIFTKQVIDIDGTTLTIPQALEQTEANKVYIMLGANGIGNMGAEPTVEQYGAFVDEIKRIKPDAVIYVQSIMVINEAKFQSRYNSTLTNEEIATANVLLAEMAAEKGVYYLDVASAFAEQDGGLADEVTPDGLHFNAEYYTRWMDYLKMHTVAQEGGTDVEQSAESEEPSAPAEEQEEEILTPEDDEILTPSDDE